MGIQALYRKPNTSKPHPEHAVYPYLLRGLAIDSTDVTVGGVKSAVQLAVPVPVPAVVARS